MSGFAATQCGKPMAFRCCVFIWEAAPPAEAQLRHGLEDFKRAPERQSLSALCGGKAARIPGRG